MDFAVHSYRSSCGRLQLSARVYPGAGPALLLMHGLTRNAADFEPLAAALVGRYRLVVPDQRGRGLSEWDPDPANYRPDIYAADMFALLGSLGLSHATAIGTSMGGLIALVMNAMDPAAIPALVLNDVGPVLNPAGLARIQGYVGPSTPVGDWAEAAERCRAINAAAFPDFGPDDWMTFARRTCVKGSDGIVAFAYDPAIATGVVGDSPVTVPADLWPMWNLLGDKPVLVVRGMLSDLLSAETAQEMMQRHRGPFTLAEVPRVGHAPILDEPVAASAIEHFLAEHAA